MRISHLLALFIVGLTEVYSQSAPAPAVSAPAPVSGPAAPAPPGPVLPAAPVVKSTDSPNAAIPMVGGAEGTEKEGICKTGFIVQIGGKKDSGNQSNFWVKCSNGETFTFGSEKGRSYSLQEIPNGVRSLTTIFNDKNVLAVFYGDPNVLARYPTAPSTPAAGAPAPAAAAPAPAAGAPATPPAAPSAAQQIAAAPMLSKRFWPFSKNKEEEAPPPPPPAPGAPPAPAAAGAPADAPALAASAPSSVQAPAAQPAPLGGDMKVRHFADDMETGKYCPVVGVKVRATESVITAIGFTFKCTIGTIIGDVTNAATASETITRSQFDWAAKTMKEAYDKTILEIQERYKSVLVAFQNELAAKNGGAPAPAPAQASAPASAPAEVPAAESAEVAKPDALPAPPAKPPAAAPEPAAAAA